MLTQEQLEVRKTGIGASEIAAIVGWSPWQGPMDIYNLKTGITRPEQNRFMEAGTWLESSVADWFASRAGVRLQRCNHTMRHKKCPWALATPDRFILSAEGRKRERLCEIKTVGRTNDDWGSEGTDAVPRYYFSQVQYALAVTGMETCDVVALFMDSRDLRTYRVEYSESLATLLLEEARDFWENHVVPRVPPEIDGSDASKDYLNAMFRDPSEQIIDAPEAAEKWIDIYNAKRAEAEKIKEEYEEACNWIKAYIGPHAGMRAGWGTALWKQTRSNGTDWEKACDSLLDELQNVGVSISKKEIEKQFKKPGYRKLSVRPPRNR